VTSALPGTAPSRRAFPPPPPTSELPDPGGNTAHDRAFNRQRQVADDYTAWRNSFPPNVSADDLKAAAGAYAYSPPAHQLAKAFQDAVDDTVQAGQRVGDVLDGPTVAPEQEGRAGRVWARAVRLLDSKNGPAQIASAASDLVANADPTDIAVLRDELPAYLESKQAPFDWLPSALIAKIPGAAEAARDAKLKLKALAMLGSNHARLMSSMVKDTPAPPLLNPADVSADDYVNPTEQ
jgi:hypothetical protein